MVSLCKSTEDLLYSGVKTLRACGYNYFMIEFKNKSYQIDFLKVDTLYSLIYGMQ